MRHLAYSLIVLGLISGCGTQSGITPPVSTDPAASAAAAVERARTELELGDPEAALATLDTIRPPLPDELNSEVFAVRADALFALGRTVDAVRLLVEREVWLNTSAAIIANQQQIWDGLALPLSRTAAGIATGDEIVDGWLALIPLTRISEDDPAYLAGVIDWRQNFVNHPAVFGILAPRPVGPGDGSVRPGQIALLLPLSGTTPDLKSRIRAILDGFVAALLSVDDERPPEIRVYDTNQLGPVESYREAQLDGADFIVGPVFPAAVDQVISVSGFIPTLTLNVSTATQPTTNNVFQYALSSNDEIAAIVARAIAAGHETAVVLRADNERGARLTSNFRSEFEARGGRVVGVSAYGRVAEQQSAPVEDLLSISASEARYNRLRSNLNMPSLEFEPRRRSDIDMIFLQADPATGPQDARLLNPLLRRLDAADIPTYATPDIYNPARSAPEPDLDGLIFPDLPFLVAPIGDAANAAEALSQYSTDDTQRNLRYFAFGFDAYRLAEALYAADNSAWPLAGATGELVVGDNGIIQRVLPMARFSNGEPGAAGPALQFDQ